MPEVKIMFALTAWKLMVRVSDQLHAGEINLIETTPRKSPTPQKPALMKSGKKRRDRHVKKKLLNVTEKKNHKIKYLTP